MSLTRELTRLVRAKPVADEALAAAALFVLDTLAAALAARSSPQGERLLDWYRNEPRDAGRRAFLFGALAHVLELDDLHRESVTHPGCVVVPAAWMLASGRQADGRTLLTAVLRGYEAVCRIGSAVGPSHYKIWHNTATCGPFGAAFASAELLELDEPATVWALGNAGTQAAGFWQFLEEGAMSKHLHAGRATEAGLLAAELAARGFTGPARILEGRKGFFAATCPDALPERVLAAPDDPWQLTLTSIKPWPSCRHTHPCVTAALELHEQIDVESVSEIRIETYQAALDLCDNPTPRTEYEAKFSLQHCTAVAVTEGAVGLGSFGAAAREQCAALSVKTRVACTDDFEAAYPDSWGARLSVQLRDGRRLVADCPRCKGDPPIEPADVRAKAARLLGDSGLSDPESLLDAVLALPEAATLPKIESDGSAGGLPPAPFA